MKLLTHNMLTSKCLKGVQVGYPLKIIVSKLNPDAETPVT
jgi:multifunctional methyltransferase subunit TRM112